MINQKHLVQRALQLGIKDYGDVSCRDDKLILYGEGDVDSWEHIFLCKRIKTLVEECQKVRSEDEGLMEKINQKAEEIKKVEETEESGKEKENGTKSADKNSRG